MKKSILQNVFVLIGLLLYNLLFWQEKLGLNLLIFSTFLQISLLYLHPENRTQPAVVVTGVGTLLTAVLVVLHNSLLVKVIHFLSLFSFAGFVQERELRFIFYAFRLFLRSALRAPLEAMNRLNLLLTGGTNWSRMQYQMSIVVIPLLVLGLFYGIYYAANPKFAELSNDFWAQFSNLFHWDISLERVLFFLGGLLWVGGMFWKNGSERLIKKQLSKTEQLIRIRMNRSNKIMRFGIMALKKEYQSGFILVISLNVLLALVNFLDIRYVWFGEQPNNPADWKVYVHEGTYLLIVAILLGMLVLLVLFRKNLNFLADNQALKTMAYVWIAQNAILALSVGIRNWRYVEHCGLAYKRIGVFIFLILVVYGLYTMYQKVVDQKTLYFLMHRNAWAMYAMLVAATLVNWDVLITKYNLTAHTENPIDVPFLIYEVSAKNLYVLSEHQNLLTQQLIFSDKDIAEMLDWKWNEFKIEQEGLSVWSWNWVDWRNRVYLESSRE